MPVAVPLSVTVHASLPDPVIEFWLQLSWLNSTTGSDCPAAPRFIPKVWVAPPAEAVNVAVCAVVTAAMVAVNPALVAPEGTVTDAGMVTASSLLERDTTSPLLPAAPVRLAVHASLPAPTTEL